MGIVFSGMFGLGIVLYTKIQSDVHLDHILFGDMLVFGAFFALRQYLMTASSSTSPPELFGFVPSAWPLVCTVSAFGACIQAASSSIRS